MDASPVGLGVILTQTTPGKDDTKVMAYASRSLTPVESRYSHIEKEALAIIYGIEHFRLYLYGHVFTLITDNKPLELIYKNLQSRPSSRIERWCLRLQEYSFHVKYRPGPKNPSDYLSRHPCTATNTRNPLENIAEEHVCLIAENAIPVALDIACIKDATRLDPTLSKTIEFIQTNNWTALEKQDKMSTGVNIDELHALYKLRDELTV